MKKVFYAVVSLVLALAFIVIPVTSVQAASTKGYHKGDEAWAFIEVVDEENDEAMTIFNPNGVKSGLFELSEVKGLSYNKKTNTLTMKNFIQPNFKLTVNEMGSDFKIKVVGKNEISSVVIWGYGYAGCLELTGSGTLTVNKSKSSDLAFFFYAENSPAAFKVGKKVKLNAYAGNESGASAKIDSSTVSSVSKAFAFNGRQSTKKVEKSKNAIYERVEKCVKTEYGNWYDELYTLSKGGETYWGFAYPGDYGIEFYICKGTGKKEGDTEIVEIVEQIKDYDEDPFVEAGYSLKQISTVYGYTFKGNIILK